MSKKKSGRRSKSPVDRGTIQMTNSDYSRQQDEEIAASRMLRRHGEDRTILTESLWRAVVIIGLLIACAIVMVAAVFAILAWTESDELGTTTASIGQTAVSLGFGSDGAN